MSNFLRSTVPFSVLALALAVTPAAAAMQKYRAELTSANEVPPNDSEGTGTIEATYDTDTMTLSWTGSYSGLTGPVIAAHFHGPADPKTNAPPLVPVDAGKSPFQGTAKLTADQAKDFADGKVYFNLHTADHKMGEIRGQLAAE